jgi:Flp pilus assembly protein TadG
MAQAVVSIAHLLRARRCVAALEFALIAPVLVMVLAGAVDLGLAVYTWTRLQGALAVGANFAMVNAAKVRSTNNDAVTLASEIASLVSTGTGVPAADVTVVVNNGPTATVTGGTPATGGTASGADACYCPSGAPGSWTWGSAITCASPPSTCAGSTNRSGKFVTITASYAFSPFFPAYHFVNGGTMSAGAAV